MTSSKGDFGEASHTKNGSRKLNGDMKMKSKLKMMMRFLIGVSFIALSACGGSNGSDPEPSTDCVIGTSTIGDCTI